MDIGIGKSAALGLIEAGRTAAREASEQLGGGIPDLAVVFSSIKYAHPRVLQTIRSTLGGAPLVGMSTAGEISDSGLARKSLVVMALRSSQSKFLPVVAKRLSAGVEQAVEEFMKALTESCSRNPAEGALWLFGDGLRGTTEEFIASLRRRGCGLPIAGGLAGDDLQLSKTYQYYQDQVFSDAVVGVHLEGRVSFGISVGHGWWAIGSPHQVTRAEGCRVFELESKPPKEWYGKVYGRAFHESKELPLARALLGFPIGYSKQEGENYVLREAVGFEEQGSVRYTGSIPSQSWVSLMMTHREALADAGEQAASQAYARAGAGKAQAALLFYGAGRDKVYDADPSQEFGRIRQALGGGAVRIAGATTYGEIVQVGESEREGPSLFNNTVTVFAFGD